MKRLTSILLCLFVLAGLGTVRLHSHAAAADSRTTGNLTTEWTQWLGSPTKNNTPVGHNIPTEWNVGDFDYETGEWDPSGAKNIKWAARLGSQTYGNCVVADGKIYVTNEDGLTTVFKAGPEFELLAENATDEYTLSSVAISDGQIFLRTDSFLYAIGTRR